MDDSPPGQGTATPAQQQKTPQAADTSITPTEEFNVDEYVRQLPPHLRQDNGTHVYIGDTSDADDEQDGRPTRQTGGKEKKPAESGSSGGGQPKGPAIIRQRPNPEAAGMLPFRNRTKEGRSSATGGADASGHSAQ